MSCCGQKRAALSGNRHIKVYTSTGAVPAAPASASTEQQLLRYLGEEPLSLRGPISGVIYHFFDGNAVAVDTKDIAALLRSDRFVAVER